MHPDDPGQSQMVPADLNPKKRKREFSADEAEGRPSAKQARSESPFRDAEDLSLSPSDAHNVLTVLEATDTDGLLDRLFNYPEPSSPRVTFRSLLKNSSNYSLRYIRSALNHLLPSTSQSRALLATGASNQQRFVDFAQGLFNEVSARKASTIVPKRDTASTSDGEDDAGNLLPVEDRKRKYALVQRLPTGDWWSSATIPRDGDVGLTRQAAKSLSTKQAELVSIIPAQPIPVDEMPLFSSLKPVPVPSIKPKEDLKKQSITLPNRTLPAPKLLDYGVYSTFAPYFDSENTEVGNDQIHQVVHESLQRRRARALRQQMIEKQKRLSEAESATHKPAIEGSMEMSNVDEKAVMALEKDYTMDVEDASAVESMDTSLSLLSLENVFPSDEVLQNLQNIIPQNEADVLKQAFAALRTEFGISDLLEHVAISLDNLVDMQRERLREMNLVPSDLEKEIATAIQSSISLLLTLRPRTSSHPEESIIPPTSILRALHRSLPVEPTSGYRGTLSTARTTSLRDDATMFVKATARAQAAAATAAAAAVGSVPLNGTPRMPQTPTPMTPISQPSQYHTPPFHGNPSAGANPMMYGYHPGYPSPGISGGGGVPPTTGGAARVMPNVLSTKGVPLTPGGPWTGYGGAMAPPYLGKAPPVTPVRANPSFYKQ